MNKTFFLLAVLFCCFALSGFPCLAMEQELYSPAAFLQRQTNATFKRVLEKSRDFHDQEKVEREKKRIRHFIDQLEQQDSYPFNPYNYPSYPGINLEKQGTIYLTFRHIYQNEQWEEKIGVSPYTERENKENFIFDYHEELLQGLFSSPLIAQLLDNFNIQQELPLSIADIIQIHSLPSTDQDRVLSQVLAFMELYNLHAYDVMVTSIKIKEEEEDVLPPSISSFWPMLACYKRYPSYTGIGAPFHLSLISPLFNESEGITIFSINLMANYFIELSKNNLGGPVHYNLELVAPFSASLREFLIPQGWMEVQAASSHNASLAFRTEHALNDSFTPLRLLCQSIISLSKNDERVDEEEEESIALAAHEILAETSEDETEEVGENDEIKANSFINQLNQRSSDGRKEVNPYIYPPQTEFRLDNFYLNKVTKGNSYNYTTTFAREMISYQNFLSAVESEILSERLHEFLFHSEIMQKLLAQFKEDSLTESEAFQNEATIPDLSLPLSDEKILLNPPFWRFCKENNFYLYALTEIITYSQEDSSSLSFFPSHQEKKKTGK